MKQQIPTQQTKGNIADILSILAQTPEHLARLSGLLSQERLQSPLAEGERSFLEVLAHLVNCELRTSGEIYLALMADEPFIHDIHPERQWGKLWRHDLFDFSELLSYFTFRRKVLMRVLNTLTDAQWSRVVREENKQRKESVYLLARVLCMHEQGHIEELERFTGSGK